MVLNPAAVDGLALATDFVQLAVRVFMHKIFIASQQHVHTVMRYHLNLQVC